MHAFISNGDERYERLERFDSIVNRVRSVYPITDEVDDGTSAWALPACDFASSDSGRRHGKPSFSL
jgi:hypothetical protein